MSFKDIAYSNVLYISVIIGIALVIAFIILYFVKSYKRAIEIGMAKKEITSVIKSTALFSLAPSIAIVIGMFSIVGLLGIAWPWFRLSVIGSVTYELMATDSALTALGISDVATAGAYDFGVVMFTMTLCIISGVVIVGLFGKKIHTGTLKIKSKDKRWGTLAMSTFLTALAVVFIVPMLLGGGVTLLTFLTSAAMAIILSFVVKVTGLKSLNNFILAISLLVAMASSVLWTNILG